MIFDTLENLELYTGTVPQLKTVAEAMDHDSIYDKPRGKYITPDPNVSYEVAEYIPGAADVPFEFHKKTAFVHIVLSGMELFSTSWRELKNQGVYKKETDTGFFTGEPLSVLQASQGRFAVFLPGEPFKTAVSPGTPSPVKKVIFTLKES